jgi:hypothetical protein
MSMIVGGVDQNVDAYRVLNPWGVTDTDDGASEVIATGGQATYSEALDYAGVGDTPWLGATGFTIGDDTPNAHSASFTVPGADPAGTPYLVDMSTLVTAWISGGVVNNGYCLVCTAMAFPKCIEFASRRNADPTIRPTLTVDYTVPDTAEAAVAESTTAICVKVGI